MTVAIIAELGSNHDGSLGQAMALAAACIEAGADWVKAQDHRWQHHGPATQHPPWMPRYAPEGRIDYLERTCFAPHEWGCLSAFVRQRGAKFMVSPFSVEALEEQLKGERLDGVKIASGQVKNRELLQRAMQAELPVFLSCGMTTWDETKAAMVGDCWIGRTTLLLCTSEYPCKPENAGLPEAIALGTNPASPFAWGYSDHTLGSTASLAAVTLGATAIERHVGWDRRAYSSDAQHSLTVDEFAAFVRQVRELERMLNGKSKDEVVAGLGETRKAFLHGA